MSGGEMIIYLLGCLVCFLIIAGIVYTEKELTLHKAILFFELVFMSWGGLLFFCTIFVINNKKDLVIYRGAK